MKMKIKMKTLILSLCLSGFLFSFLSACSPKENSSSSEVITIDVNREYPKKKMLLQEMAEVEYIRLETTDELLWKGWAVSAFTDRFILDYNVQTGDLLFFDQTGRALRKINRQGGGAEEYSSYSHFVIDEEQEELYFNDRHKEKIFVYELDGTFKRAFDYAPDKRYSDLCIWDADRLIAYNDRSEEDQINTYLILSKQTGEIEKELTIPQIDGKLTTRVIHQEGENVMVFMFASYPILCDRSEMILTEISNDTIFTLDRNFQLKPLMIQKPSRPAMDPQVFLFYAMDSRDYLFYHTVDKKLIGEGMRAKMNTAQIVYDKKEGQFYQEEILNGDYTTEHRLYITPITTQRSAANQNIYTEVLQAGDLIEAYANNQLQGKLKEIAKELEEEDNPVILVARFR